MTRLKLTVLEHLLVKRDQRTFKEIAKEHDITQMSVTNYKRRDLDDEEFDDLIRECALIIKRTENLKAMISKKKGRVLEDLLSLSEELKSDMEARKNDTRN